MFLESSPDDALWAKANDGTLSDPAVRQALNLLVDRGSVEKFIYGRTGNATANFVNNPDKFRSKNTTFYFNQIPAFLKDALAKPKP